MITPPFHPIFAGHRRANMAAAVFESVRHLRGFGVGDAQQVGALCRSPKVRPSFCRPQSFLNPGLNAIAFEVRHHCDAADAEFACALPHGEQGRVRQTIETA